MNAASSTERVDVAADLRSKVVDSFVPPQRPTNVRYWVLGVLCAAATIAYIQRYSINKLVTPIQQDLGLDKNQIGTIMFGFFCAYGALQVPAGWLGDRWGSRKSLTLYAVAWSLLTGLMGLGVGSGSLLAIWSLMGAAQAGIFPCAMIAVRDWLPVTRRALASGLLASCMSLGGAIAPLVVGWLLLSAAWPWQRVFFVLAVPGLVWAALYYAWFRDKPEQKATVNEAELQLIRGDVIVSAGAAPGPRIGWYNFVTSFALWMICFQQFFRAAAQVFFGTWFGTFLEETPQLSARAATLLASVPLLALIVGSVIGGIISDWLLVRTGSRRIARQGLSVVNLLLCGAMFLAACLAEDAYVRVALISLGSVAMAIGGVSAYAITMDMGGRHVATVFSIMNMTGSIGSALFPKYVGWLMETTHNWNHVLLSISLIYFAAAGCWMLLNPSGTIFDRKALL